VFQAWLFDAFQAHPEPSLFPIMTFESPVRSSRTVSLPFLSAVAIALGLAGSTFIAASSWKEVRKRPEKNNIRITGSARKRIVSDLIH
jgi:hypothetical protein